ncbi:glutamate--tRNA ligase [Candidatus Peregrinibacteria bacterium]|jgi:glutamyl-tRNA synthetase|nr:glutamate--tRNA ligase [Candidatus Peregrinibacteria bacterium]MBT4148072.1 glutamate--tRNA ligase [Candidatus Peregrinibacteria bacterium]MBT4366603.1 glutamate--tRNA ligase [Candidatus Peregrinibacteria bacterium]MBT4456474.1 glutamate--tRNA ligase [Candidatus Peregrinibacteria bacterium]
MPTKKIKTRFAPSPTGYLHVGGLRTALYCYLFARKEGGSFVLRIEDTDQERFVEGATESLINTLKWVGLEHDEGPHTQSERTDLYIEHAEKLLESGHAYHCFCSKDRLTELREKQESAKQATMYDRKCGEIPLEEARKRVAAGEPHVIRQKIPYENLKFKDLIRGNVQFDGKNVDDQVLVKSDGFPTYHLANVVDDHLMEITHVIRGEEWLPSTPKHIFLYKAFGWEVPEFAHIPLLLNKDRSKLSKRQGHVAVEDYIKEGYLKEAILNFVVFLGWHPGAGDENELYTLKELEKAFSIDRVHKSGAIFDIEKLDWYNWLWQKKLFNEEMQKVANDLDDKVQIEEVKRGTFKYKFSSKELHDKFLEEKGTALHKICEDYLSEDQKKADQTILNQALIANEEKVLKSAKEIAEHLDYFFTFPDFEINLITHEKMKVDLAQAKSALEACIPVLEKISEEDWTEENLAKLLIDLVQKLEIKNGQLLWPIRVALTGQQFSPGTFEMLWALGKEESLDRINNTITRM